MVNIRKIAALAEVSPGTVSRVMHGGANVKEETRLRVQKAIDELKYTPVAVKRQSNTICAIIPDEFNPTMQYYAEMLEGIMREAFNIEYNLSLVPASKRITKDKSSLLNYARVNGIGGFLVIAPHITSTLSDIVAETKIPYVIIAGKRDKKYNRVNINNFEGAVTAVDYLISLGHKRIALIQRPENIQDYEDRELGYRIALENNGIKIDESLIVKSAIFSIDINDSLERLFNSSNPPSAVFVSDDDLSAHVMGIIKQLGINVPKEVSVVGFGNSYFLQQLTPTMTVVKQPTVKCGKSAIQLLKKIMDDSCIYPMSIELETEFIVRKSTGRYQEKNRKA